AQARAGRELHARILSLGRDQGLRAGSLLHPDALGVRVARLQGGRDLPGAEAPRASAAAGARGRQDLARGYARIRARDRGAAGERAAEAPAARAADGARALRLDEERAGRLLGRELALR